MYVDKELGRRALALVSLRNKEEPRYEPDHMVLWARDCLKRFKAWARWKVYVAPHLSPD